MRSNFLTGYKDVDRFILEKLSDTDLLKACLTNQNTYDRICDETFFRNRVITKYSETVEYKDYIKKRTWKNYFLIILYYKDKLLKKYGYVYDGTDASSPELEYLARKIGVETKYSPGMSLIYASENPSLNWSLPLVKYLKDKVPFQYINSALISASRNNNLPVVEYLTENGADITAKNNEALISASASGFLNVVKYLIKNGAEIHARDNAALKSAIKYKRTQVVKYLQSLN